MKILTVCRNGLVRSVALADVLKMHFEPVDVIPIGAKLNSPGTQRLLYRWADKVVLMSAEFMQSVPEEFRYKVMVCEVGPDIYGDSHNKALIAFCWNWVRQNQRELGVQEHLRMI